MWYASEKMNEGLLHLITCELVADVDQLGIEHPRHSGLKCWPGTVSKLI